MLSSNILCIKKKKRKDYYVAAKTSDIQQCTTKTNRSLSSAAPMLPITEDTPPDMLTGAMDLTVHLPDNRKVKMSVERSTPMMDLLIHITTLHHLQLSNYTLHALSMAPTPEHRDKVLPYKPNTPIGALDTQYIKVVAKFKNVPAPKPAAPTEQPFESTFRLKVHLPRNQLYVTRVSQDVLLKDILKKVCEEKNLDPGKYELRHPENLNERLDPNLRLNDYQITEVYILYKETVNINQILSSTDIMALRREEERKQLHNKTGGGVFNLIFRRGRSSSQSSEILNNNTSAQPDNVRLSVTSSELSQENSTISQPQMPDEPPKPPLRKRRPAPKPPKVEDLQQEVQQIVPVPSAQTTESTQSSSDNLTNNVETRNSNSSLTICHSRNSSDSSGYHEASVLSENYNTTLPRRPNWSIINENDGTSSKNESTSNLTKMSSRSKSAMNLAYPSRKKKNAPPPPPVLKSTVSLTSLEDPSHVAPSQPSLIYSEPTPNSAEEAPPPISSVVNSVIIERTENENESDPQNDENVENQNHIQNDKSVEIIHEKYNEHIEKDDNVQNDKNVEIIHETFIRNIENEGGIPHNKNVGIVHEKLQNYPDIITDVVKAPPEKQADDIQCNPVRQKHMQEEEEPEANWQYQLPSPPTAFRDSSPTFDYKDVHTYGTDNTSGSVPISSELIEKLKDFEASQIEKETVTSDTTNSVMSEESKTILNSLSLEHLEERKSLVYRRELATSLKITETPDDNTFAKSLENFEKTYEDVKRSSQQQTESSAMKSNLPNFKITTYDNIKQVVNIFEDDSIRSNSNINAHHAVSTSQENLIIENQIRRKYSEEIILHKGNNTIHKSESNDSSINKQPYQITKDSSIGRSESFSQKLNWSPSKPVMRSKSHVTLDSRPDKAPVPQKRSSLPKSSSLFDVSGLQSLEVMRLIQNTLNTYQIPKTKEVKEDNFKPGKEVVENKKVVEDQRFVPDEKPPPPPTQPVPAMRHHYRLPTVSMGTWSERPKIPVNVKDDPDYKYGHKNYSRQSSVGNEVRTRVDGVDECDNHKTFNGIQRNNKPILDSKFKRHSYDTEGASSFKPTRIIPPVTRSHTLDYRKPFRSVNETRPEHHLDRFGKPPEEKLPIVRSVELKKPFHDSMPSARIPSNSTSNIPEALTSDSTSKQSSNIPHQDPQKYNSLSWLRSKPPVFHLNNPIAQRRAPTVLGFRNENTSKDTGYTSLPPKVERTSFAQATIPTSSSELNSEIKPPNLGKHNATVLKAADNNKPVPPKLPKTQFPTNAQRAPACTNPRDELLQAIRSFGGKKGFKTAKV